VKEPLIVVDVESTSFVAISKVVELQFVVLKGFIDTSLFTGRRKQISINTKNPLRM